MKYISKALFIVGFIVMCIGVCMGDANFILAIRMLLWGAIIAWRGYLLTEYCGWLEEIRNGL